MTLRGTELIDFVQRSDILAAQAAEPADVRGQVNVLADGRLGKFGWKAQFATLIEFMGDAFTHEMGVTNPLVPNDEVTRLRRQLPQARDRRAAVADRRHVHGHPQSAGARRHLHLVGRGDDLRVRSGAPSCHTPSLPGPNAARTINLYSDLLLHDMGPGLADQFVAGSAARQPSGARRRSGAPPTARTSCTTGARRRSPTPSPRTAVRAPPPRPPTRRSIRRRSRRCSRSSAASEIRGWCTPVAGHWTGDRRRHVLPWRQPADATRRRVVTFVALRV